ncbi:MAG: hypothetical protein HUJ26_15940 [Planctomycetaceae bacterium]|nr:hypothetical protein [Planctomycetaceae bacterium]
MLVLLLFVCSTGLLGIWIFFSSGRAISPTLPDQVRAWQSDYEPPSQSGYVGSNACIACHNEIAERYAVHPMANSTRTVRENIWNKTECLSTTIPGDRKVLAVKCDGESLVHLEQMYDGQQELIYEQRHPVNYAVGSGQRAKAYLLQVNDLLFMSPLNWYQQSESWDLAPNYRPDDIRGFRRRVTEECLSCHSGLPVVEVRNSHRFPSPVFHEQAIGCERCHGPGEQHILFWENYPDNSDANDPIVNPSRLDHVRQESVCYQCHLSASARVLRPGRSHLDFVPGMKLSDVWGILDRGTEVNEQKQTKSINHVQQMRDSQCYQGSSGTMGCITCHDPHGVPGIDDRIGYYREKCFQCHQSEDCHAPLKLRNSRQNSCIDCHMPSLSSSNMSHVAQTDHRIIKDALQAGQVEENHDSSRSLELFEMMKDDFSAEEFKRIMALGTYSYHQRHGLPYPADLGRQLEDALQSYSNDYRLLTTLGYYHRQQNHLATAQKYLRRAVEAADANEEALDALVEVAYLSRQWSEVVELTDQLLQIDVTDPRLYAMKGDALVNLGRVVEGVRSVEEAVRLNPGNLLLREWLLKYYQSLGWTAEAEACRLMIQRLESASIPENLR